MSPAPDVDLFLPTDAELEARRTLMVRELRRTEGSRRRAPVPTSRRAVIALGVLGVAGGGVAGATALLDGHDVAVASGIGCYESASLDANVTVIGPRTDPLTKCASLWRQGVVDGTARSTAPKLVACTAKGQPVRVFPGTASTCKDLGLVPLPANYAAAATEGQAIIEAVGSIGMEDGCLTAAEVRTRARSALDARGLDHVLIKDSKTDGGCAYVFIDGLAVTIEAPQP